jgi:tetratricopeptide (TPR) repeat protein
VNYLTNLIGMLAFRTRSLRAAADGRALWRSFLLLSAGFLVFIFVRNSVYAVFQQPALDQAGFWDAFFRLNFIQAVLFLSLVYVPAVILLSNSIAGDGLGFSISREEYQSHISALFPLWGVLFLLAAPLQWLMPQFLVLAGGMVGISIGLLILVIILALYSIWAIKELNYLSVAAALAVFVFSWLTLPVFYVLSSFLFALPLFIMLPLIYLAFQRWRGLLQARSGESDFKQHLQALTANPQDADAHYQLGLVHLKRGNLEAAGRYFGNALAIDPGDADYHYYLGRVYEIRADWQRALEQYEETYRLNPEYALGDIFREVGKGYLHTGKLEKAVEFLKFFLENRSSDPEGRYWLAVASQKLGNTEQLQLQLRTVLEQARSNPRFFRRENRKWLYRARVLLNRTGS